MIAFLLSGRKRKAEAHATSQHLSPSNPPSHLSPSNHRPIIAQSSHPQVIEPVVESPTYKAMSFAAHQAAHQAGEFWNDKARGYNGRINARTNG